MQVHSRANRIRSLNFFFFQLTILLLVNKISENRLKEQRGKPDKRQ
jgi:hypothetical protein